MTDELTLAILAEIAKPGSGQLFSRREAARHAIAMIEQQAGRIAAAEADAIERCAKFMEARADEIAAADNYTANMMAMVYRDEAKSLRALLPKEE